MSFPRRRWMVLIAVPLVLYALLCGALYVMQDVLVFPGAYVPRDGDVLPPRGIEVVSLQRVSGAGFRVVERVPTDAAAVLLFFAGNGEDLHSGVYRVQEFTRFGIGAVVVEYPGYGKSEGPPSVAAFLEAAEAAAVHARDLARARGLPLVVGGSSLGTFCAVHLAAQGIGERLLLHAPATSTLAAARHNYWWVPVGWLLRHRFDNLGPAVRVECPTLIVHGAIDNLVPQTMGRELAAAIGDNATFLEVAGHGHNHPSLSVDAPVAGRVRAFLHGK